MRETILAEIRRIAAANGGKPPGVRAFRNETNIGESLWRGVYWARWGDAVAEAGLQRNAKQGPIEEESLLATLAAVVRMHKGFPTAAEWRLFVRQDPSLPNRKTLTRRFGSKQAMLDRLARWADDTREHADVAEIARGAVERGGPAAAPTSTREGLVYLIKSGSHFKVGRSDNLERRVKEIRVALPDAATLVHAIRTDDPAGIEAYWHKRFAERRANGEWFRLTSGDVAAFKRRRFQ
jgi:hypothetical protein